MQLRIFVWVLGVFIFMGSTQVGGQENLPEDKYFNYRNYREVLDVFVNNRGNVNYMLLKANRTKLDSFVKSLNTVPRNHFETWPENEQISFLINAYNSFTLKLIIDNYPIRKGFSFNAVKFPENSIRQIKSAWEKERFKLLGEKVSLDMIEHEMLRKNYSEPGVHLTLVCASKGCPPLRTEVFYGEKLKEQLDDQAVKFLKDNSHFQIDRDSGSVWVSKIFEWFGKDFIEKFLPTQGFEGFSPEEKSFLNFMSQNLKKENRNFLVDSKYQLKYLEYDWTLNEQ